MNNFKQEQNISLKIHFEELNKIEKEFESIYNIEYLYMYLYINIIMKISAENIKWNAKTRKIEIIWETSEIKYFHLYIIKNIWPHSNSEGNRKFKKWK